MEGRLMNRLSGKRAFTLVEILIAVAIIVVAFIPVVNLVSSNAVSTVKVGNYAKASALMTKFLEEVKHVPFSEYHKDYDTLRSGNSIQVPEKYYPDTLASLNELKQDKEFWIEATMKASANDFDQLIEIAFNAEIFWKERGDKAQENEPNRSVKDYALVFNPEARY